MDDGLRILSVNGPAITASIAEFIKATILILPSTSNTSSQSSTVDSTIPKTSLLHAIYVTVRKAPIYPDSTRKPAH